VRERSARVPLIASGPQVPAGHRVPHVVSLVDLFPTILDVAGIDPVPDFTHVLDGHSLAPFLLGNAPADWPNEAIVENFGEATIAPIRSLTNGRYKFIYVHGQPDQLHDLEADPLEWTNLLVSPPESGSRAADVDYTEVARDMKARLLDGWDPAEADRLIRESQHRRAFLKEALFEGKFTPWDFQPFFDAGHQYVRRSSNQQWDPHLGH
jgi:choline-sulfatase